MGSQHSFSLFRFIALHPQIKWTGPSLLWIRSPYLHLERYICLPQKLRRSVDLGFAIIDAETTARMGIKHRRQPALCVQSFPSIILRVGKPLDPQSRFLSFSCHQIVIPQTQLRCQVSSLCSSSEPINAFGRVFRNMDAMKISLTEVILRLQVTRLGTRLQ